MAKSMTGFGRSRVETEGLELTVEIKTLNHRYLDINLKLPRKMSSFEEELRRMVKNSISRGRVEIYITYNNQCRDAWDVKVNEPLANAYLSCFKELSHNYGIRDELSFSTLLAIPDLFVVAEKKDDEELLKKAVIQAVSEALEIVDDMKAIEGRRLMEDVLERLDLIRAMIQAVERRSPLVVEEYRKKLKSRISDLLHSADLDENRFNTEVAYFAERCNIAEEVVRLYSHIEQLEKTLEADDSIGRKLDFIVQEMNRETNTIGSKAGDLAIINLVVDIKSEIEKIREQIQNIE